MGYTLPMPLPLTPKQQTILSHIAASIDRGTPPTLHELARHFRLGLATIQEHIAALQSKGALTRQPGQARGLRIAGRTNTPQARLPLLGRVPAGPPSTALTGHEDLVSLDKALAQGADYLLKVKGDSMAPDILEGDLVLVRQTQDAQDGDRVVALLDGDEATVKFLRRKARQAWLEPANPRYKPIKGRPFTLAGKVVGLLRSYGR